MNRAASSNDIQTEHLVQSSRETPSTPSISESVIQLLVLTDDQALSAKLESGLEQLSFDPRWASTYEEALDRLFDGWTPEIVVVDLLIPRAERYSICRVVKTHFGVPVIAVGEEPDTPRPAKLGADDYLGKPISPLSLSTCVRDVLQRELTYQGTLVADDLVLDPKTKSVLVAHKRVNVSREEFALLARLALSPDESVSRTELFRTIRGGATDLDRWLVDIHLTRLMVKLAGISRCRISRAPNDQGFVLSTSAKN